MQFPCKFPLASEQRSCTDLQRFDFCLSFEQSREALDRALDKIFHPPKFDIRALSQVSRGLRRASAFLNMVTRERVELLRLLHVLYSREHEDSKKVAGWMNMNIQKLTSPIC